MSTCSIEILDTDLEEGELSSDQDEHVSVSVSQSLDDAASIAFSQLHVSSAMISESSDKEADIDRIIEESKHLCTGGGFSSPLVASSLKGNESALVVRTEWDSNRDRATTFTSHVQHDRDAVEDEDIDQLRDALLMSIVNKTSEPSREDGEVSDEEGKRKSRSSRWDVAALTVKKTDTGREASYSRRSRSRDRKKTTKVSRKHRDEDGKNTRGSISKKKKSYDREASPIGVQSSQRRKERSEKRRSEMTVTRTISNDISRRAVEEQDAGPALGGGQQENPATSLTVTIKGNGNPTHVRSKQSANRDSGASSAEVIARVPTDSNGFHQGSTTDTSNQYTIIPKKARGRTHVDAAIVLGEDTSSHYVPVSPPPPTPPPPPAAEPPETTTMFGYHDTIPIIPTAQNAALVIHSGRRSSTRANNVDNYDNVGMDIANSASVSRECTRPPTRERLISDCDETHLRSLLLMQLQGRSSRGPSRPQSPSSAQQILAPVEALSISTPVGDISESMSPPQKKKRVFAPLSHNEDTPRDSQILRQIPVAHGGGHLSVINANVPSFASAPPSSQEQVTSNNSIPTSVTLPVAELRQNRKRKRSAMTVILDTPETYKKKVREVEKLDRVMRTRMHQMEKMTEERDKLMKRVADLTRDMGDLRDEFWNTTQRREQLQEDVRLYERERVRIMTDNSQLATLTRVMAEDQERAAERDARNTRMEEECDAGDESDSADDEEQPPMDSEETSSITDQGVESALVSADSNVSNVTMNESQLRNMLLERLHRSRQQTPAEVAAPREIKTEPETEGAINDSAIVSAPEVSQSSDVGNGLESTNVSGPISVTGAAAGEEPPTVPSPEAPLEDRPVNIRGFNGVVGHDLPGRLLSYVSERRPFDPMGELCPYELMGRCKDYTCHYQHTSDDKLPLRDVVLMLLQYAPEVAGQNLMYLNIREQLDRILAGRVESESNTEFVGRLMERLNGVDRRMRDQLQVHDETGDFDSYYSNLQIGAR